LYFLSLSPAGKETPDEVGFNFEYTLPTLNEVGSPCKDANSLAILPYGLTDYLIPNLIKWTT